MTPQQSGLVQLHLSTLLLAGNGFFARAIHLPANDIITVRSFVGAAALLLFAMLRRYSFRFHTGRDGVFMLGLGAMMGLHWITFFHSMQIAGVAVGMVALYTYPVLVVFIEPLLKGERPQRADIGAAVAVLFGVYLIVPELDFGNQITLGLAWGLVSAAIFALRNALQRHYMRGYPGEISMFYQGMAAGLVALPFFSADLADISAHDWMLLLMLGVVISALAHTLLAGSLRTLSAKTVSLISCLSPVYSVPITWLTLGEVPDWNTCIGGAVIIAAAMLETRRM